MQNVADSVLFSLMTNLHLPDNISLIRLFIYRLILAMLNMVWKRMRLWNWVRKPDYFILLYLHVLGEIYGMIQIPFFHTIVLRIQKYWSEIMAMWLISLIPRSIEIYFLFMVWQTSKIAWKVLLHALVLSVSLLIISVIYSRNSLTFMIIILVLLLADVYILQEALGQPISNLFSTIELECRTRYLGL